MELRPYQKKIVSELIASNSSGIVCAPTGSGKSVIMANVAGGIGRALFDVAVIVWESSIADQLRSRYGLRTLNPQTLTPADLVGLDLVFIDEVHHYRRGDGSGSWYRIIEQLEERNIRWIGFTATPMDEQLLGRVRWRITYEELRRDGWLAATPVGICAETDEEALQLTEGIPTVTYIAPPASKTYNPAFGRLITADTPTTDRHFRRDAGETRLCCMNTLTTGWDDADVGAVILNRQIGEAQTYLQIIGRLRRGGLIVDRSNNIARFGLDEDRIVESLSRIVCSDGAEEGIGVPICVECVECRRMVSVAARRHDPHCPYCGAMLPPPTPVTKFWTPFNDDSEWSKEWESFIDYAETKCRSRYECPYTPSGAWVKRIPGVGGRDAQAYFSPSTSGHWLRVAQIYRSCMKRRDVVMFASGTYWLCRQFGADNQYVLDISYGSQLIWRKI